jgi:iron complex outermembrane receptor protein
MKNCQKTAFRAASLNSFASLLGLMAVPLAAAAEGQTTSVEARVPGTEQDAMGGLEEIVVTAQKRAQNSQSVPIAITALSGSDLQSRGILDPISLVQSVPGLNATITAGYGGKLNFTLRGVGLNTYSEVQEAAVALYQDEFYIASANGSQFSMFDNERIEVLRGPQGTLFGRSASGGLINFINKEPGTEAHGYLTLGLGSYGEKIAEAAQDVPLDKEGKNALRASVRYDGSDGFMRSRNGGKNLEGGDKYAARVQLRLEPTSTLRVLLKGEFGKIDSDHSTGFQHINAYVDDQGLSQLLGPTQNVYGTPGGDFFGYRDTSGDYWSTTSSASLTRTERTLFTSRIDWDLGGATLTSLTGYMNIIGHYREDTDGTSIDFLTFDSDTHSREVTQEIRLSADPAAHLKWTVGGFYFNYKVDYDFALNFPTGITPFGITTPMSAASFANQNRHSYAGFGQIEFPLATRVNLTVGGRVEREHADLTYHQVFDPSDLTSAVLGAEPFDFSPALNGNLARIDKTYGSGGVTLDYRPQESVLLYTSLKRGIKPGGFSTPTTSVGVDRMKYNEEKLDAVEGGVKSDWFNHSLRLNTSVYHYWYKDYQAVQYSLQTYTGNATARASGADAEVIWAPTHSIELGVSGGYVDAIAENIPLVTQNGVLYRDRQLPNAPKVSLNPYIRYQTNLAGGAFSARFDELYRSKTYYEIQNHPALTQSNYHIEDLSLGWTRDDWTIAATASNLFNTKYLAFMQDAASLGFIAGTPGKPRWFTLQLTKNW